MKIHIKNMGILNEAKFEVGDLTLICGGNNTGKTYTAHSLYGWLDYMRHIATLRIFDIVNKYEKQIIDEAHLIVLPLDVFKEIIAELCECFLQDYKKKIHLVLGIKENKKVDFTDDTLKIFCKNILEGESKCRYGFNYKIQNNKFCLDKHSSSNANIIATTIIGGIIGALFSKKISTTLIGAGIGGLVGAVANNKNNASSISPVDLLCAFFAAMVKEIFPLPFILSSERTGISVFRRDFKIDLSKTFNDIQDNQDITEIFYCGYLYPKPLQDNIRFMESIPTLSSSSFIQCEQERNNIYKEIIALLKQLIGGEYQVVDSEITFSQEDSQEKCTIEAASSSVRSLLMLYYYILHKAKKGDILMIDEPELNLHPNNQILIARLFALLVNAGIRVFITTHSDYIVRELSNCIMLHSLSDGQVTQLKEQGYTKGHCLESQKVKAYLAESLEGKNTLTKVNITQEQGIFMKTFDEPIDSQNENQGLIFKEIMRGARSNH